MINIYGKVAILIDADNAPKIDYLEPILKISEYYGELQICRAYGDWNRDGLDRWSEIRDKRIDLIQVDQVGKNATDHHLLVELGEMLGESFFGNNVDIFIIVSGDGGFTSACKLLQERGKQVVVMGSKGSTAESMRISCHKFYILEDLDQALNDFKTLHSIPPNDVRRFEKYLFRAYHQLIDKEYDWVSYSRLGTKLHEFSDYENKFGKYNLSEWLRNLTDSYESNEQIVRRIDRNPEATRKNLLYKAYSQTPQLEGRVNLGELNKTLFTLKFNYEDYFGSKNISHWVKQYPDLFNIEENYVSLT